MIHFNDDKRFITFNGRNYEKERLKKQIYQLVEELSEEDLYYYLEILNLTIRYEE